jgi:hypothetical protein
MTSALSVAAAEARIAARRANVQRMLHDRVDATAQRIFRDRLFLTDTNVIPMRATLIGQVVLSAQQLLVSHVNAEISRQIGLRTPPRVSPQVFERPGVDKTTVYSRPFYTSLQAIRGGKTEDEALTTGSKRLRLTSATDLQMAKVRQARIALKAKGRATFKRVTTGDDPCELCQIASDQIYYTDNLMPIHPGCFCDVEADEDENDDSSDTFGEPGSEADADESDLDSLDDDASQRTVEVREHGEIGPMLTWADQNFTGPEDLPSPPLIVATYKGGATSSGLDTSSIEDQARAHLDAVTEHVRRLAG